MRTNDTSIVPADNQEPHMALDAIERLLQQRVRNNIAPYGLEVDCPALLKWSADWDEPSFHHQNLVREVRIWSELLARKPLARTLFNDPFRLMDAPSLTELVYAIGQNFKLLHGHHAEHCAIIEVADLTQQNLALLKGLDFNHICLKVGATFDLQELQVHRQMLTDFKFQHFSLELDFDSSSTGFLLHLMELLSFIEPTSVCFNQPTASPIQQVEREGFTAVLMQFGYFIEATGTVLKCHSPLNKRPRDTVRLGPGSRSRLVNLQIANFCGPTAYAERLDNKRLAAATCF